MKNIYKPVFLILIMITSLSFQSCDILQNFFLNLPIKEPIVSIGNGPTISEIKTFCLEDYDAYSDNIDDIQSVTYVAALYRTLTAAENSSPPPDSVYLTPGLAGQNIIVTVVDGDGVLIFSRTLPTAVAADYIDTPYKIELTTSEITLLNNYLAQYKDGANLCFTATLTMNNISAGSGPPYTLTGQVELLLSVEIAP
jgi:hypothetical protein